MILKNKTDEELMVLYQSGNENAFQVLYQRYSKKILNFIQFKVQERSEDIFQEVFIKIHRSKHLYNSSMPLAPWLFTVTRNVVLDELRRVRNERVLSDKDFDALPTSPIVDKSYSELQPALLKLGADQKKAIELRYVDEKTFEEIAIKLNTTPANARQIISRGIRKMKQFFNGENHE